MTPGGRWSMPSDGCARRRRRSRPRSATSTRAARRDLAAIERRIAECLQPRNEYELRRLHEQLDAARRDASAADAELARLKNRAAEARRAAEAAKAEYFRRAECSPVVAEAKERIRRGEHELEDARRIAVDRLHDSHAWRRAEYERDGIKEQLDRALWCGTTSYEVNRLKRELAAAEDRLRRMEHEAATCDPIVRDAEARLAAAKQAYDDVWACVERDLGRDPGYGGALADAARFDRDAEQVNRDLCAARDAIARIERDIDRLRGETYVSDTGRLEREAMALRGVLDRLTRDARAAEDCLARADRDVADARCAYDAALANFNRCRDDGRRHDDRGRYERGFEREYDRGHDKRDGGKHDDRKHDDKYDRKDDRKHDRDPHGSYRDRGERYERARGHGDDRDRDRGRGNRP